MKTILVIDSVSRAGGGLLDSEKSLHQNLLRLEVESAVLGLQDEHTASDLPNWAPLVPQVFPHRGPGTVGASPDLRRAILGQSADIIYRAGLWRLPSKYAHEWSKKHRRPEIIAPHGMLDPWAVRNSRWKKRLAHLWFEGAHLRDAACIRALCESEANAIRSYGLKNPVCIIPNGVDLPEDGDQGSGGRGQGSGDRSRGTGRKILLFLGRLHPKKGLPNALRAWHSHLQSTIPDPRSSEWQFVIAGWDQGGHEAELKRLCDELGLAWADVSNIEGIRDQVAGVRGQKDATAQRYSSSLSPDSCPPTPVLFVGPAFGVEKDQLLRSASAFILPSFSEGLPMSVLEAWSYRLPVLMTDHCNLPEGFAADAAIRIGTDVESIAEGLRLLLQSPIHDLQSLGDNGRQLVSERFTWPMVAKQMKEVYEWVLGGGEKPCSVVL